MSDILVYGWAISLMTVWTILVIYLTKKWIKQ